MGFCCPNIVIQEQSLGLHYHQGFSGLPEGDLLDYLADPHALTVREGSFQIFSRPGLGIELDEEKIMSAATDWRQPDADWIHADGTYAEW